MIAELLCQADRAKQYSRRNCLSITGIPEARDEDIDNIIVTMAKDLAKSIQYMVNIMKFTDQSPTVHLTPERLSK
ncbi:hypothetical protein DPMN_137169 [Dreissena polymorpha]|uniref:Uncharacterized protein n=1 Tax=Dreissena polymorpha TaxID=45954 RepID=A0A9D4G1B1_DREPO|nr:hypothetical protein DPMN_137169 [Dreissena polymorpha]